jgi:hypothetical protein
MLKKLMLKYNVNITQLIVMFIVFGVTGSVSAKFSGPISNYFNLDELNVFFYWPLRILILFPIYQILLIWFGFIFNFFYNMSIKMMKSMIRLLSFGQLFKN